MLTTPSTLRTSASACFFVAVESTTPNKVTIPRSVSTLMSNPGVSEAASRRTVAALVIHMSLAADFASVAAL